MKLPLFGYILCLQEANHAPVRAISTAAQTPRLEFEVAFIKPLAEGSVQRFLNYICRGGPGTSDPTLFTCPQATLKKLILRAYDLRDFQLSAPDWTEKQPFELKATVPPGVTREQFETTLQNLLIGRFKLAVHREPKEIARYELVIAECGTKLKETKEAPTNLSEAMARRKALDKGVDKVGYPIQTTPGSTIKDGRSTLYQPHGRIQNLILFLNMQMDKPVVDATGLKGTYEIVLHWAGSTLPVSGPLAQAMAQARAARGVPENTTPEVGPGGPTLQQALRDQLGLKLESKKGPMEILVIDRGEKMPMEN